jgi:aminopeptidase
MAEGQHFETCDLENAQGKSMGVNNPSDEVFGTPSARRVSGHMTTTRPFIAEGEVVEGIYMEFEDGKMVKAVSLDPKHQDLVDRYFNDESGTTTMSEVGLVDAQGALAAESHNGQPVIFNNGICDENTGIHIALGHSYLGMTGGKGVSEGGDAADAKGVGTPCHFDLVIGGPGSTVRARNKSGEVMEVITQGSWKM